MYIVVTRIRVNDKGKALTFICFLQVFDWVFCGKYFFIILISLLFCLLYSIFNDLYFLYNKLVLCYLGLGKSLSSKGGENKPNTKK